MQLRGGEGRDRAVHNIARPREVIATLISRRLLSHSTSSAPRFQARQMRSNFQVNSSVRQWSFAIRCPMRKLEALARSAENYCVLTDYLAFAN